MIDLKALRIENHMTQGEVAKACGVVRQTISNIECGLSRPSIDLAKRLGELFHIEWTYFFAD